MHQAVAHSSDFFPGNPRLGCLQVLAEVLCGLRHGLERVSDTEYEAKFGIGVLCPGAGTFDAADGVDRLGDVCEPGPVRLFAWAHSGMASRSTRSRNV